MLDVDFEWFDPQPAVDFHGLKTLLRQLLDVDNQLFDLSELVDLILSQPKLGSTVKVEGNESDPFAFLTVLNLHQHRVRTPLHQRLSISQYLSKVGQASRQRLDILPPFQNSTHPCPRCATRSALSLLIGASRSGSD